MFKSVIPSKIFEAMGMGLPIIAAMNRYPNEIEHLLVHTGQHYDEKMIKAYLQPWPRLPGAYRWCFPFTRAPEKWDGKSASRIVRHLIANATTISS